MVGVLASQGIHVGSLRVGQSLARVQPANHSRRAHRTERLTNPIPYSAKYFGHKVHIDQNEKLVLFGVTHVCAHLYRLVSYCYSICWCISNKH